MEILPGDGKWGPKKEDPAAGWIDKGQPPDDDLILISSGTPPTKNRGRVVSLSGWFSGRLIAPEGGHVKISPKAFFAHVIHNKHTAIRMPLFQLVEFSADCAFQCHASLVWGLGSPCQTRRATLEGLPGTGGLRQSGRYATS